MENMSKENFWDNLIENYPKSMKEFCDFIDEYKTENNWNELFSEKVKFHHVPVEMQLGIWIKFMIDNGQESFTFGFDVYDLENLWEWVSEWFHHREIEIENPKP